MHKIMLRRLVFFILLLHLLVPGSLYCQQQSGQRPKIGYVLSGVAKGWHTWVS